MQKRTALHNSDKNRNKAQVCGCLFQMVMHDNAIAFMVHLCCEAAKNIYAVYWLEAFDPVRPKW
jgi:hypothetical protein